jgi:hypothetical protein
VTEIFLRSNPGRGFLAGLSCTVALAPSGSCKGPMGASVFNESGMKCEIHEVQGKRLTAEEILGETHNVDTGWPGRARRRNPRK